MTGILDRIAGSHAPGVQQPFHPASPDEFFALRLAERLNDAAAVLHYIELCNQYSTGGLLTAYRQTMKSGAHDLTAAFHARLARLGTNGNGASRRDLAAIRIERRAVAVAIFVGGHLKYPPIARHLSADPRKALGSAAMFIDRLCEKCAFSHAVLETLPPDFEAQRSQLATVITEVLVQKQVAIWQFPKSEVIAAFGFPALRFRGQVRDVAATMWPEVDTGFGTPLIHDALALGLYCQIEHLLSVDN